VTTAAVEVVETHMSVVFLAGDLVYKMKRPVRLPFVDYTTLEARRLNCEREATLNQRLALGVYLGAIPLLRRADGSLSLVGSGVAVEWLVVMRRLDRDLLLDRMAARGEVTPAGIDRLCDTLAQFYSEARPVRVPPTELLDWWRRDIKRVAMSLANPQWRLPRRLVTEQVRKLHRFIDEQGGLIVAREQGGHLVDGHGDLRPEHVQLGPPVLVIDRLEFDERLRRADPFDEAVFLGLECERLGAAWIGPRLIGGLSARLAAPRPPLLDFYRRFRCCLRAQLSIEHLRDPEPRTPERWPRQAVEYLEMAGTSRKGRGR
jgi:aminoglycoside phosphotransferase family enzyme